MGNLLVKIFGQITTVFFGDPAVFDRYLWLKRNLKGGSLRTLDAGCGSGAFALYAAKVGNSVLGISFEERNNGVAKERAEILGLENARFITADLKRLDEMKGDSGLFDQIICFETIEHVMDDQKLIKDLSALLKPGGRLLLTTPFKYGSFWKGAVVSPVENGDHVRVGYDADDLRKLFESAGLVLERDEYISGFMSQKLTSIGQFLSRRMNSNLVWAIIFPFRALQMLDPLITRLTGYKALSIGVIGRK